MLALGEPPQRLLENLRRLTTLSEVAIVDDYRRHSVYTEAGVEFLALTHLPGELVGGQDLPGARLIETDTSRDTSQHIVIAGIAPLGEIGVKQGVFAYLLPAFTGSPALSRSSISSLQSVFAKKPTKRR